jgi:hypothetical protein
MENLDTYLYIFFAVIYVVSRIIKARAKKNQQQVPTEPPPQQVHSQTARNEPRPKKAFSFDDILKEFEKNLSGEEIQEQEANPVEEIRHVKPTPIAVIEKANPYQNYSSKTKEPAQNQITTIKPVFERNEKFAIIEEEVNPFVEMIRNPDGFKNAIVLSEIINRKYF